MMAWLSHWYGFLTQLDQMVQNYLPMVLRLLLWPTLAWALSSLFYRLALPREKMKEWQLELIFQRQLNHTFRQLGSRWSGNKSRQRRLAFLVYGLRPLVTVLTALFLCSVLLWLPQRFAWHDVGPGSTLLLAPQPAQPDQLRLAAQARAHPAQRVYWSDKLRGWTVQWPSAGERIEFRGADGQTWFSLAGSDPGAAVAPASWWQWAWPALELQQAAPFEWIQIQRRPRHYLPWGPLWLRTWWLPPLLLAFSYLGWLAWRAWRKPGKTNFFAHLRPDPEETPSQITISAPHSTSKQVKIKP